MHILFLIVVGAISLFSPGLGFAEGSPSQQVDTADVATIAVQGMTCGSCERTIRDALTAVDGVQEASADHQTGSVTVRYDSKKTSREKLEQAISAQGYTVADTLAK